jgi:proteasome lid subunit RPN8/RPN11
MDAALGSFAHDRVAGTIPPTGVSLAGTAGAYRERPMPVGAAILWTPVGLAGANPTYPIFITQRALDAVHAQLTGLPEGSSSLGFLVGGMYQAPDTRAPYIVVESTIRLPWSISGDDLEAALRQDRIIAQEEVRRSGAQLLGWYHSHFATHSRLSPSDVEARFACFDEPWHVALVVARGAELTGGVFRIASRTAWSNEYLPFYEVPDDHSLRPDGRTVTRETWANYRTHGVELSTSLAAQTSDVGPPLLLFPDELDGDADALPAPVRRRLLPAPVVRAVRFGAMGLVACASLFGAYRVFAGPEGGAGARANAAVSAAVTPDVLDRLADTVAFAVTAFEIRLRLYDGRKMACPDLAQGLVDLEARWMSHSAARKATAATLDSARIARDRGLNADVGAVERRFTRTGCARP